MRITIIIFLVIASVVQISAGRTRPGRILKTRWVFTKKVGRNTFLGLDTLKFFNHSHDIYGTQNPNNHPELIFDKKQREFRISFQNRLYGKYEIEKKNNELHLIFYEPDPMKPGSDIIDENWNKTGENLYTIQSLTNDSLILIRKK